MWADRGEKAPRLVSAVPPQKVADAVVKVIRGSLEALVTPAPLRPLLALNEMFPALQRPIVKRMGVAKAMRGNRGKAAVDRRAREGRHADPLRRRLTLRLQTTV